VDHSFHSEKRVSSLVEKPIHIMNKFKSSITGTDGVSFHISVQKAESSAVLKNVANEVLNGSANKPLGLRNNKHASNTFNNRVNKIHSSILGPGVNKHHSLAIPQSQI